MPNPYATNKSSYRPTPVKQVALGQSSALKRLEKLQAKHTGSSVERRSTGSPGKTRKSHEYSLDSDEDERRNLDDDDEEDDDEDSLFKNAKKNANKFMKQKPSSGFADSKKSKKKYDPEEDQLSDSQESDLEISVMDRSSTPLAVNQRLSQMRPSSKTSSRLGGAASAMSSLSSLKSKRSHSKVKFMKTKKDNETITDQEIEDEAESTILEELMNNLMTVDDLEPAAGSTNSFLKSKPAASSANNSRNRFLKSPLRVSLEEKDEDQYSSLTPSIDSPSMSETKFADIEELEKSLDKKALDQKEKKRLSLVIKKFFLNIINYLY